MNTHCQCFNKFNKVREKTHIILIGQIQLWNKTHAFPNHFGWWCLFPMDKIICFDCIWCENDDAEILCQEGSRHHHHPVTEDPIDMECIPNFLTVESKEFVIRSLTHYICALGLIFLLLYIVSLSFSFARSNRQFIQLLCIKWQHQTSHVHIIVIVIGGK